MPRLVTIGDSISQGFMSGGTGRADLAYSALVAKALGLGANADGSIDGYSVPQWPHGGIPLNIEMLLRHLMKYYGADIWGPFEWTSAAVRITNFIDRLEDHYERGAGDFRLPSKNGAGSHHNLASFGFTVADSWQVTPNLCRRKLAPDGVAQDDDQNFATPSNAFYRSAHRVLQPVGTKDKRNFSQLDWVKHYADDDGLENLIVWYGSNNALGTVLHMKIKETKWAVDKVTEGSPSHARRGKFNLWTAEAFQKDYSILLDKIVAILNTDAHTEKQPDWRVFLADVPAVTVAPIAKGVGPTKRLKDPFGVVDGGAEYFEHYTYVIFDEDDARNPSIPSLTRDEAYYIDRRIKEFNDIIKKLMDARNKKLGEERFHLVPINSALLRMAYKRNGGTPTYQLPNTIAKLDPPVNTGYYDAKNDRLRAGGIFSLDGVHPSAIGHGLLAREFLWKIAESRGQDRDSLAQELDWDAIIASDRLYKRPLNIIREIYDHDKLARLFVRSLRSED